MSRAGWRDEPPEAWDAASAAARAAAPSVEPGTGSGTTTDCPLEGVHEHPFRGPHRFTEWYPIPPASPEPEHEPWCWRRHTGDCVDGPSDTPAATVPPSPEPTPGLRTAVEALINWNLHPDRSYSPREIAMTNVERLRAALAASPAPEPQMHTHFEPDVSSETSTPLKEPTT